MAFTIVPLPPPSYSDNDAIASPKPPAVDVDGDIDLDVPDAGPPWKRSKLANAAVVTPGESVTEDPQWMRCRSFPPNRPPNHRLRPLQLLAFFDRIVYAQII